jgi:hypothetical protein
MGYDNMRELTTSEIKITNGGNPLLIGIGIGIGANYVYDSMGGAAGINSYLSQSYASASASASYNFRRLRRTFKLNEV